VSVAYGFAPAARVATARTRDVPARLGAWQGTDLPIDARVHDLLETDDVLLRRYRSAADLVDVLVVHAADSRKVAHPPEICFAGGGFVARDNGYAGLPATAIPARRLVLDHDRGSLLVYYWYRIDGRDGASYIGHELSSLWSRLRRRGTEASMIRLSTPLDAAGVPAAETRIERFAAEALPGILERLP
jgi:EpsI family protein